MGAENIFTMELSEQEQQPTQQPMSYAPTLDLPGGNLQMSQPMSEALVVTEVVTEVPPINRSWVRALFLAIFVFAGLGFSTNYFLGVDSVESLLSLFGFESSPRVAQTVQKKSDQIQKPIARVEVVPENPYWKLPNPKLVTDASPVRSWTSQEESAWREGMQHQFIYQRYRTVNDIRAYKLGGSETLLWEALNEKKLWLRMNAAFSLAEMGQELSIDSVQKALGDERPSLLHYYLNRFMRKTTEGERYILRQALKIVDAKARLLILKSMAINDDPLLGLYLVAATYDPGFGIKNFANAKLRGKQFTEGQILANRSFILGTSDVPYLAGVNINSEADPDSVIKAEKVSQASFISKVEYFGDTEKNDRKATLGDRYKDVEVIEIK